MVGFLSVNQAKILGLLFANPKTEYSMAEIGRALNKKPGVFKKALDSLEKQGIIASHFKGNQRLASINRSCPSLKEVKALYQKNYGIHIQLKAALDNISDLELALIYGSYADGKMRVDSDIDVLLVATRMNVEEDIIKRLEVLEKEIQTEINHRLYTVSTFNTKRKNNDPFLEEILSSPYVILKGSI